MNWRRALAPSFADKEPRLARRFGRLCYWFGVACAGGLFAIAVTSPFTNPGDNLPGYVIGWGVGLYVFGRASCYLFGGE